MEIPIFRYIVVMLAVIVVIGIVLSISINKQAKEQQQDEEALEPASIESQIIEVEGGRLTEQSDEEVDDA